MSLFRRKTVKFKELPFRTDVHSHLLPGVDDGFKTGETSLSAIEIMRNAGVERIILTPHVFPELYPDNTPSFIRGRFASLAPEFEKTGMKFRIAGEHMIYEGFEEDAEKSRSDLLVLPDNMILIEMSYVFESLNIKDSIFYLNSTGLRPVLAHPERYIYYSKSLHDIRTLMDMDCRLQLNLLSLGGFYGRMVKAKAELMLEKGLYSYLGTDLHRLSQIDAIRELDIPWKYVPALEKLCEANDNLFDSAV